jgi:hypothetical protein
MTRVYLAEPFAPDCGAGSGPWGRTVAGKKSLPGPFSLLDAGPVLARDWKAQYRSLRRSVTHSMAGT